MKKSALLIATFSLAMSFAAQSEAIAIRIGGPDIVFSNRQPVIVVIVDSNGNTYEQTYYYDPSLGGLDIDPSFAGPGASIYIPSLGMGYLWYNGYWVDQQGYYWNGRERVYINYPDWHEHWHGYWEKHHHDQWRDHHEKDFEKHDHFREREEFRREKEEPRVQQQKEVRKEEFRREGQPGAQQKALGEKQPRGQEREFRGREAQPQAQRQNEFRGTEQNRREGDRR